MQKQAIALVLGTLLVLSAGALLIWQFAANDAVPPAQHNDAGGVKSARVGAGQEANSVDRSGSDRTAATNLNAHNGGGDHEVVTVVGRVINAQGVAIHDAVISFEHSRFGRGVRPSLPGPICTSDEGRFVLKGRGLRNWRVSMRVRHAAYAPGLFDRRVGAGGGVASERAQATRLDLGDLMLMAGCDVRGRVTDSVGNGIAAAAVTFVPQNRNRWRLAPNVDELLAKVSTDSDGYYRQQHLPTGDWCAVASATQRSIASSVVFVAKEATRLQVDEIRLGQGFEVAGVIQDQHGESVVGAKVSVHPSSSGAAGRDWYSVVSNQSGRFLVQNLPGGAIKLEARADGYLHHVQQGVADESAQPIVITMRDCLHIVGRVVDGAANQPVTAFAIRAFLIRALPVTGGSGNGRADQADRGSGARRGPARGYAMSKPQSHANGMFALSGLQEGVYEVAVRSSDYAFLLSDEIELRAGGAAIDRTLHLDRGFTYAGVVVADSGRAIGDASIEMTPATPTSARLGSGGNGEGGSEKPGLPTNQRVLPALHAKTNATGEFLIEHVVAGAYQLTCRADGFRSPEVATVEVLSDRFDGRITLAELGGMTGSVDGLRPKDIAASTVIAIRFERGDVIVNGGSAPVVFGRARVETDRTYSIRGLEPGAYLVRAYVSAKSDKMQSLARQIAAGGLQPDVTVKAGARAVFDVKVTAQPVGTVTGLILHNGLPAKGCVVELIAASGEVAGTQVRQRATVGASGTFKLERVDVGRYSLRVRTATRAPLYEEAIEVAANRTLNRHIQLATVRLRGSVSADDGADPSGLNGDVTLISGVTELPPQLAGSEQPVPGRRASGSMKARLRGGNYEFDAVPPGRFLLVVTIYGRERSSEQIVVGRSSPQQANIRAGALAGGKRP
ncbi:MAG: hypothetical protein ACI89X_003436 [Planctomycetota bacterium]|jgi:hypothetical protein